MLGKFNCKVLIKVSDYPSIKFLPSALFSSSLIDYKKIIVAPYICQRNGYDLSYKSPALLYWKIKFLTSFNSSLHNHMFLIF